MLSTEGELLLLEWKSNFFFMGKTIFLAVKQRNLMVLRGYVCQKQPWLAHCTHTVLENADYVDLFQSRFWFGLGEEQL